MDLLINGLQPGQDYALQVRAKNGDIVSEWSTVFDFTVEGDSLSPAPPTGLSWAVTGTAFTGSWTAPTTNTDSSLLKDLKDYKVTVTANSQSVFYFITDTHFTLSYEANVVDFAGAQPTVQISVQARDTSGNLSTAVTASAMASAPSAPTGFTASGVPAAAQTKWDVSTDTAFDHFELYMSTTSGFTPGPSNLVYSGPSNAFTYTTSSTAQLYFQLRQLDVFHQASGYATGSATPLGVSGSDTTPPSAPSGVTTSTSTSTDGSSEISVSWTAVTSSNLGFYVVRYSTDGTNWQFINVPRDQTTTIISNLLPNTNYDVAVAAVSLSNYSSLYSNSSTYPQLTAADTTAPSQPAVPTVTSNTQSVQVAHNMQKASGGNLEADTDYLEVHGSATTGFTPSSTTLIGTVQSGGQGIAVSAAFYYGVNNSTSNMYWKVIAVDKSKNKSTPSAQATALPGLIQGINIASATITDANINNLNANKITAGTGIINDLTVNANLTIGSTGHVKSSNYDGVSTGWSLDTSGLEIFGGTISAAALQLQDSANLAPAAFADFEFNTNYYHDASNNVNTVTSSADSGVSLAQQFTGQLYGRACMRVYNTSLASGTHKYYFAPGGATSTGVNVPVNAGTYILSLNAKKNGTPNQSIKLSAYTDTGSAIQTGALSVTSTTYSRINGTITIPSGVQQVKLYIEIGPNSGSTGYDVLIDGLQIERQLGGLSNPSPWRPPGNTSIDGGSIVTGSITSSAASATITGQPAWSIDTAGNMLIGNAQVRGSLIVGSGSEAASSVLSGNYIAGSTGWTIKGDGSVEFNNGTFRGTLDISQTINSNIYDFNVSNQSSNYRVNIDPNNPQNSVGISGNAPSTTYKGYAQQYVTDPTGVEVFDSNVPTQAILRLTPEGRFQIMNDPTNSSALFTTDGYNLFQSSGTARINQHYSFAESWWGPTRNNQSVYGYPGRSQVIHQARSMFADSNGAATTPKMELLSLLSVDAAAERGAWYDTHTNTIMSSSGYHRFASGNKVKTNFDNFTQTLSYYSSNMSATNMTFNNVSSGAMAAGRTNLSSLAMFMTASTGTLSFTTSSPTYDYTCNPGDQIMIAAWFSTVTSGSQVAVNVIFNNSTSVQGGWEYINQAATNISGQLAGFPYFYGHSWFVTVPAGATAAALQFKFQGLNNGNRVDITAVTMAPATNDNDKVRFAEIGRTDSISGEASINLNWEPYPTFYGYSDASVAAHSDAGGWGNTNQDSNSTITLKTSWIDSLLNRDTEITMNPDKIAFNINIHDTSTFNYAYVDGTGMHSNTVYSDSGFIYGSLSQAVIRSTYTPNPAEIVVTATGVALSTQHGATNSLNLQPTNSVLQGGNTVYDPYIQLNGGAGSGGSGTMYFNMNNSSLTHPFLSMQMTGTGSTNWPYLAAGGETWHTLPYANGWGTFGSGYLTPGYRMGPDGKVWLQGMLSKGTITDGTIIATLPAGYRPSALVQFTASTDVSPYTAILHIDTSGNILIYHYTSSMTVLSVDGLSFAII